MVPFWHYYAVVVICLIISGLLVVVLRINQRLIALVAEQSKVLDRATDALLQAQFARLRTFAMEIPKDKNFPPNSVQCDTCGGNGCPICDDRGWLSPKTNPHGRRCLFCMKPLEPNHIAVYCSNECARADA